MNDNNALVYGKTEGPIGWLVFNNPARHNAISIDMAQAVPAIMAQFEADPAVRVVVLTGAGERAFIAGSDISTFGDVRTNAEQNRKYQDINQASYDSVYRCAKPTIARIRGYCIGGGMDYAASCDLRICSDDSSFAIPAVKLGLGYGYEGQIRISRLIGPAQARELYFTGRRYGAEEALKTGLVHRVVAAESLDRTLAEYAAAIAENAPLTIKALKRVFIELEQEPGARDMQAAHALIAACYESQDYQEGRAAFAEKRRPRFEGK